MKRLSPFPRSTPWLLIAPFLLPFLVFVLWPLGQSLVLAFQQTFGPRTTAWNGVENFTFMFTDQLFWIALRNTAIFAAGSVFIQLPLSLGLALLLNRADIRGRGLLRLIFVSPWLVGTVFGAVLFAQVFEKRFGLLNGLLHWMFSGWDSETAWLQGQLAPLSLIIAGLWLYVGFNMIYFLAALQSVSRELVEAATIDGASRWQRFRHIVWPEIRPVAGFVTLLSIIGSLQLFELPFIMFNYVQGPQDSRGLSLVIYLYQTGFQTGNLGYASAIGWVLALMLVALAWLQRRLSRAEKY